MKMDYLSRIISGLLIFISLNVHGNPYQDKDMKDLTVKKINVDTISVEEIPALFKQEHIAYQTIANVNWKDSYPYCPQVEFGIAYTDKAILLHYQVTEESVRAVAGHDNGPVWEDACVEFFSMLGGDDIYYNVECNCTGTLLVGAGATRSNRQHAPQEVLDLVSRWASLGKDDFEERIGTCSWEVALVIPFSTFFLHDIQSLEGKSVRANFYKCGDKLQMPHFLSWNPIDLPKPDFHCPAFFGLLQFD